MVRNDDIHEQRLRSSTTYDAILARLSCSKFSNSLKVLIHRMVAIDPAQRPNCKQILNNFLINDGELERKFLRLEAKKLNKELRTLEQTLNIKRKKSF